MLSLWSSDYCVILKTRNHFQIKLHDQVDNVTNQIHFKEYPQCKFELHAMSEN